MPSMATTLAEFDGAALMGALDARRVAVDLGWTGLADALWRQSEHLNAREGGDAMCPGALVRTVRRGTMSCRYALIVLRFLGRPPEDFLVGRRRDSGPVALPAAGPDRRLGFDLPALYTDLNGRRHDAGLTWAALAGELDCTPARLTNLRTARLADMGLVMRVTQWLGAPAARFVRTEE